MTVRLAGNRVVLRELLATDLDAAHAVVGDDRVTRWLSFERRTREQTAELIAGVAARVRAGPRTEFYLAVSRPEDDAMIGFARLGLKEPQAGQLGYAIRRADWGRGYATDAAHTLTGYAFEKVGLHRVSAAVGPQNAASVRVLERIGFCYEGRLRHHVRAHGTWRDSLLYSMLADEWSGLGTG